MGGGESGAGPLSLGFLGCRRKGTGSICGLWVARGTVKQEGETGGGPGGGTLREEVF